MKPIDLQSCDPSFLAFLQENDNNNKNTVTLKFYIDSEDVYGCCLVVLVTSEVVEWKGKQRGVFFKEAQMGLLGG